jgi:pimeloyl-ACP methyl ester carboxylesterase
MRYPPACGALLAAFFGMTIALTALASRAAQTNVAAPPGGSATRSPARSALGSVSCFDTSGHAVSFVTVEPGVQIEVLDWGGQGEPLVLLTGLGDNAHVYDHFAYQFTERFHVLGITRRGFGRSSKPTWGYDVDTRARDDVRVLDNLHIRRAVFVGHSVAGDELSKLGAVYPDRVDKLVYLDAYDYGKLFTLPQPPSPEFARADLESVERFAAASARYNVREPNAAICNSFQVDAAGTIVAAISPPWVTQKLKAGSQQAEYDRIKAPALAVFAPLTAQTPTPSYWYLDPAQQALYRRNFQAIAKWQADAIRRFRSGIAKSRVVELPGANHYVFIDDEAVVVREMRRFLLGRL